MISISVTTQQNVKVSCLPSDDAGKPAQVEGFNVKSSNPAVCGDGEVTVDGAPQADGSFLYEAVCEVLTAGVAQLVVDADADLGAGVVDINEAISLSVTNPMAKNLGLSAMGVPKQAA